MFPSSHKDNPLCKRVLNGNNQNNSVIFQSDSAATTKSEKADSREDEEVSKILFLLISISPFCITSYAFYSPAIWSGP